MKNGLQKMPNKNIKSFVSLIGTRDFPLFKSLGSQMKKQKMKRESSDIVVADPYKWSESSQRSYAFECTKEYKDIKYNCCHCRKDTIFSARDQKYTYEVKKVPIDQNRILCTDCWKESLYIANEIRESEKKWACSKNILKSDNGFLLTWLELLEKHERYTQYKSNTAAKNMLKKLINENV